MQKPANIRCGWEGDPTGCRFRLLLLSDRLKAVPFQSPALFRDLSRSLPCPALQPVAPSTPGISSNDKREKTMAEFTLQIDGMHCGSCVRRVTQALASVEGVVTNDVQIGTAHLTSSLAPAPVDPAIAALAKAGFTARLEA